MAPIGRHPVQRKKMSVKENGRPSHTDFKILEILNESSLVEAVLHTGRTHQIRVHLQHLECPLIGDPMYANKHARTFAQKTGYQAPRQMLHAKALSFIHPISEKQITIEASLPEDFLDALNYLKIRN